MLVAAKTSSFKMTPNMTTLATGIDNSITTVVLSDALFVEAQIVVIGGEQITLGSTGDSLTFTGCTRGGGEGAESHAAGQEASLYGGTVIVTHTFNGTSYLNVYLGSANVEAMFAILVSGVEISRSRTAPDNLDFYKPVARYQPAGTTIIAIAGFLKAGAVSTDEAEFSATLQS